MVMRVLRVVHVRLQEYNAGTFEIFLWGL